MNICTINVCDIFIKNTCLYLCVCWSHPGVTQLQSLQVHDVTDAMLPSSAPTAACSFKTQSHVHIHSAARDHSEPRQK